MTTHDFRSRGLLGLVEDLEAGSISAREATDAALANLEADPWNTFTVVDADGARAQADEIDRRRAAGDPLGPLAGVPIGVKDMEDARGFTTSAGSWSRHDAPVATQDSINTGRLRDAGAVVLGKTNTPEFGLRAETDNPTFGITRNPWNRDRTPGGSSGGSSAAVSGGLVPLATASDGGGSIRTPAAVTGLTALKASLGRVPMGDASAPGWGHLATRGVLTTTAADAAYAYDVVTGPDPRDPVSLPAHEPWSPRMNEAVLPRRVAWSATLGYATPDREMLAVLRDAVERLAVEGVDVVEVEDLMPEGTAALGTLVTTYTARTVAPLRDTPAWDRLDPFVRIAAEMATAARNGVMDFIAAQDACHLAARRLATLFDGVDLLLCPVTIGQTATCDQPMTVDEVLAAVGPALAELATDGTDPALLESLFSMLRSLEPINVPMGTVNGSPTPEWHGMTQLFNMTRSPAGTVCAGLLPDGMPVGLQVVGPHHGDLGVLQALSLLEELFDAPALAPVGEMA